MSTPGSNRNAATALLPVSAALAVLAMPACMVGPDYKRPPVESPDSFRDGPAHPSPNSLADLAWWDLYKDPALQSLVRESLANNYDLRIAVARIEQARAVEVQTASPLYPELRYDAALGRGRNAFLGNASPNNGSTESGALLQLGAFWEIDLWGRIRRSDEAALAQILVAEENRRGVMLTLVTSVAQSYFELLELDTEIEIARKNVASFEKTLDLFSRRSGGGVGSKLEVFRAQANLSQVAATIPDLQRKVAIKENQINILLGRTPGPIQRGVPLTQQSMPIEIPAGLPSTLLERRPDILQAEQSMIAANALIGAATADFFPRIGLTAIFGKISNDLSAFSDSTSNAWSLAGTVTGPIFNAGRTQAQVDQAVAQYQQARLQYEQTVLNAFGEVANTLVTREKLTGIEAQLQQQVFSLSQAVDMSRERFDVGRSTYFEILDAQQQLFPAETSLARTRADQYIAVIQLYRVLGGGWNLKTEQWSEAKSAADH